MTTVDQIHTTEKYYSVAETAKLVRLALKSEFPGVKFSVRSKSYSMGASIDIHYFDGPRVSEVEAVAGAFAGATFDGMTDSMNYHHETQVDDEGSLIRVRYGADFVFVTRYFSQEAMLGLVEYIAEYYGLDNTPNVDGYDNGSAYLTDSETVYLWKQVDQTGNDWQGMFWRTCQEASLEPNNILRA